MGNELLLRNFLLLRLSTGNPISKQHPSTQSVAATITPTYLATTLITLSLSSNTSKLPCTVHIGPKLPPSNTVLLHFAPEANNLEFYIIKHRK